MNRVGILVMSVLVYANAAGAQWAIDGNPVCDGVNRKVDVPELISDNAGGIFVCWFSTNDGGIYAQRVGGNGDPLWGPCGLIISDSHDSYPSIVADETGGAVIIWADFLTSEWDIYAQRIDASGNFLWNPNGMPVVTAPSHQGTSQGLISMGPGQVLIAWNDQRSATTHISAQRLRSDGSPLWAVDGLPVCNVDGGKGEHPVIPDEEGGAIICWRDARNTGEYEVFAQRIDSMGTRLWPDDGVPAVINSTGATNVVSVPDGVGGVIVAWPTFPYPDPTVRAQRLDGNGNRLWSQDGVVLSEGSGGWTVNIRIASDGAGGALVVWENGLDLIFAQRISASGQLLWGVNGVNICDKEHGEMPQIAPTAVPGEAVISWIKNGVRIQKISGTGEKLLPSNVLIGHSEFIEMPEMVRSDDGGAYVVWEDRRDGFGAYCQRVYPNGTWAAPSAVIQSVVDVPADEGGSVRIVLSKSIYDEPAVSRYPVVGYNIWRRVTNASSTLEGIGKVPHVNLRPINERAISKATVGTTLRRGEATSLGFPDGTWESVAYRAAINQPEYLMNVRTLKDSTESGAAWETLVVTAHTSHPFVYFISHPDSGYSVDNLAPARPQDLTADDGTGELLLDWLPGLEPDLAGYRVYAGDNAEFDPNPASMTAETIESYFIDESWEPLVVRFYKVSAVDRHGNESDHALVVSPNVVATFLAGFDCRPGETGISLGWNLVEAANGISFLIMRSQTSPGDFKELTRQRATGQLRYGYWDYQVKPGVRYWYQVWVEENGERWRLFETEGVTAPAVSLRLDQNHPNPFNPNTSISFVLPEPGHVKLEIFDIAGRLVTSIRDGIMEFGMQTADWNGTNHDGAPVSSGVYFYRLTWAGETLTKKMMLLK